ncbi:MAG: hypothetical protein ACP5OA_06285 [Candidatus Woesearchaeota archaeon]
MNKKGQAAMEFLMTYGWAIVVVLAAIGALAYFGVLSPNKLLPDRTTFSAPLPNVDNAVILLSGNTVQIAFKNNKGVDITLPMTATVSGSSDCTTVDLTGTFTNSTGGQQDIVASTEVNPTRIQNGGSFLLTFDCTDTPTGTIGSKFKADFSFPYINYETGQTLSQTGSVEGKYS